MSNLKSIYVAVDDFLNRHPFSQSALGAFIGIIAALYMAKYLLGFTI